MTSRNRDWMTYSAHQKPTVGDSKFSAVQYDHMGWLKCDGRLLNKVDFQFLFNVIGYSFGGSGDQFNLPNSSGRVPGVSGQGTDSNNSTFTIRLGDKIGEYVHTLTIPEMPTHSHTNNATGPTPSGGGTGNGYGLMYQNGSNTMSATVNDGNEPNLYQSLIALTINNTGSSNAHNNVQPTIGMGNMFIYSGLISWGNYPYTTGPSPTTYPSKSPSQAPSGTPNNIW